MTKDILSDFFTRVRNANTSKQRIVRVISTNVTNSITKILKDEGFISNFQIFNDRIPNLLIISLKYLDQKYTPVLTQLKQISKPGIRIYVSTKKLKKILGKMNILLISTSQGIMTHYQAKKLNLGGEILCLVS